MRMRSRTATGSIPTAMRACCSALPADRAAVAFAAQIAEVLEILFQEGEHLQLRALELAREQPGNVGRAGLDGVDAIRRDIQCLAELIDRHRIEGFAEALLDDAGTARIDEPDQRFARRTPQL